MGRMLSVAVYLFTAVVLWADSPYKPIDANYERSDMQWDLESSVGNTPVIRAYLWQGDTNAWNGSGHTFTFRYGESEEALAMATVTGVLNSAMSNTVVDFQVRSNDFSKAITKWYSTIVATSNDYKYTFAKGWLSLAKSPEISTPGAMYMSYLLNGSLYSFTGSWAGWPFKWTNGASPYSVLYYDPAQGKYVDLAAGTSGYFLETRGTGSAPRWNEATATGTLSQAEFQLSNAQHRAGIALAQAGVASNQTAITGLGQTNDTQNSRITVVETGTNNLLDLAGTRAVSGELKAWGGVRAGNVPLFLGGSGNGYDLQVAGYRLGLVTSMGLVGGLTDSQHIYLTDTNLVHNPAAPYYNGWRIARDSTSAGGDLGIDLCFNNYPASWSPSRMWSWKTNGTIDAQNTPMINVTLSEDGTGSKAVRYSQLGGAAFSDSGAFAPSSHVGSAATSGHTGLGTAAGSNGADFASAAQGVKADSAVQPATLGASGTVWRAEWQNAANLTNFPTAYAPATVTSTASNVFSFALGPLQKLRLTNSTVFYLPPNPDTNKVSTARLELDPNGQTLMLSTNTILIGTNTVAANGFTDFLSGMRTNRYNSIVIDYGLEMVTGRVFRLNF